MKQTTPPKNPNRRLIAHSAVYGAICAVFTYLGANIARNGAIEASDPIPWVLTPLVFVIAALALCCFLRYTSDAPVAQKFTDTPGEASVKGMILNQIIIFVCWIPVFLAEFPGFFVYDAADEYAAVATRQFTTHHPLLHTLLLGGSVRAGEVFAHSADAGIALYILAQMLVLSLVFARVVSTMRRFRIFGLLWYALFPTVVMFALCSVKDTVFAAAALGAVVLGIRILGQRARRIDIALFAASLLIMMLMRHNAVYAYVIWACIMGGYMAYTLHGSILKRITPALMLAGILFAYQLITVGLVAGFDADDSEHQEILTVPIQQLARTWNVYADEMDPDDLAALTEILPVESLKHYTPELSDPVKIGFVNEAYEADPGRYVRLWFKLFGEHPLSYVNAWLNTCYGYFYPHTVVNVYEGHEVYTFTYTESSYFGYEVEYPGVRHSLIPPIDRLYRWLSLDDDIQRIPVISLAFSMGAMLWLYLFALFVFGYRRDRAGQIAFLLPVIIWATLMAGPTFLPRYTVFWWFMLPYLICGIWDIKDKGQVDYETTDH